MVLLFNHGNRNSLFKQNLKPKNKTKTMKKLPIFAIVVIALIFLVSCQKEIAVQYIPPPTKIDSFTENGRTWFGLRVDTRYLAKNFNAIAGKFLVDSSGGNDARQKLAGKNFNDTTSRRIFSVQSYFGGPLSAQIANLEGPDRNWKLAPFQYATAAAEQYGANNNFSWNTYCYDSTIKINFGYGDEIAAFNLNGNTYDLATNREYTFGIYYQRFIYNWYPQFFWCYK